MNVGRKLYFVVNADTVTCYLTRDLARSERTDGSILVEANLTSGQQSKLQFEIDKQELI